MTLSRLLGRRPGPPPAVATPASGCKQSEAQHVEASRTATH